MGSGRADQRGGLRRWLRRGALALASFGVLAGFCASSLARADADAGRGLEDASNRGDAATNYGGADAATLDGDGGIASAPMPTGPAVVRPAQPHVIRIGVYLLHVHDIDLKAGTATVTYYVWTRWRADIDGTAYELVNGHVESKDHEYRYEDGGEKYAYYRCRATVQVDVDFRRFPFDEHELVLAFEHNDADAEFIVFQVDRDSVRYPATPAVSGWTVETPRFDVVRHAYRTNWGAPHISPDDRSSYSRFRVRLRLVHSPGATFTKTFLALFISGLIAALAFLIDPADLGSRIGVSVAGTFGAVTSYALVSGNLPEIPYVTLADLVHVVVLVFVFVVVLESCFVGHLARTQREARARRIDRVLGPLSMLALVAAIVGFVVAG